MCTILSFVNILPLMLCVVLVNSAPHSNLAIHKGNTTVAIHDAPATRIIDGKEALPGQFPWQAAVLIDEKTFCGGSLISDEWVLTAAHCVTGSKYRVILGTTNWRELGDDGLQLDTITFVQHEDYNPNLVTNDVGVIKLPKSIIFSAFIQPIGLASSPLGSGITVTVSGWGKTSDEGTVTTVLRYADMLSISNRECKFYFNNQITDDVVCAKADGMFVQSPCNGDSGGGLVTEAGKNPVHDGITSFVSGAGCEFGYPAGYARTAYFRNWIKTKTGV